MAARLGEFNFISVFSHFEFSQLIKKSIVYSIFPNPISMSLNAIGVFGSAH